jgi:hypothetical protein
VNFKRGFPRVVGEEDRKEGFQVRADDEMVKAREVTPIS